MKTFWRVLETLAVVTLVLVWPLGAFAQIGKVTATSGSVSSGSAVSGCTINSVVYIDGSGNLACGGAPAPLVASTGAVTIGNFVGGTAIPLTIGNGTSTGAILVANDNVTPVFTIADGGATTVAANLTGTSGYIANTANGFYINAADAIIDVNGAASYGGLTKAGSSTPVFALAYVGTVANSWHIAEYTDRTFNFNNGRCATSACTDPALIIHSHNQATTEYVQASNDGTLAHLDGQAGTNGVGQFAFAGAKTLTESSATVVVDIPVASGAYTGATINWTVVASDATDHQSRRGSTYLAVVNKAGTETCTVGDVGTPIVAVSTGTLTVTTAADTSGANVCTLTLNAVSSLTQTVLRAHYSVVIDGPGIPTAR